MAFFQIQRELSIPTTLQEAWSFITAPQNLKKITPPQMGFDISSKNLPDKIYPGMIITYRVSPLPGYKTSWVTEITQVSHEKYFIDEQRIGPYKMWHHQHHISSINGGVLMTDLVTYQPPMGFLGSIANSLFIRHKLDQIFNFRTDALIEIFGKFNNNNN